MSAACVGGHSSGTFGLARSTATRMAICAGLASLHGIFPVHISCAMSAKEYTSHFSSTSAPSPKHSGAM